MFDECSLTGGVSLIHGSDLRHGHVRLVDNGQKVFWKIVEQATRRFAGFAIINVPRIVLDSTAEAKFTNHF